MFQGGLPFGEIADPKTCHWLFGCDPQCAGVFDPMKEIKGMIVMPDSSSHEIEAREQTTVEVERHAECFIPSTIGPWVVLPCDADSCLVGDVAGKRKIFQCCLGAVGKAQAEALFHGNQIGWYSVLIQDFDLLDANSPCLVAHA